MTRVLHFWLGPVQPFIASARRTRDLWAGSFLLSWLSGHAMKAALNGGGRVIIPAVLNATGVVEEPMLAVICNRPNRAAPPLTGTLPNHFRAEFQASFDPEGCRKAVLDAWRQIAQAVFETFVKPVIDASPMAETIWQGQIPTSGDDPFWETMWVEGDNPNWNDEIHWLDRRKAWRNRLPPKEDTGYDHCMMMPDWAELSGFVRSKGAATQQDAFWDAVKAQIHKVIYDKDPNDQWLKTLELRQNERLCAIALVKRLFPLLPPDKIIKTVGWIPVPDHFPSHLDNEDAAKALRNWPSTAFMSAVTWIDQAMQCNAGACEQYAGAQRGLLGHVHTVPEMPQHHKVKALTDYKKTKSDGKAIAHPFTYLDGGLFFPRTLEANRYAKPADTNEEKHDKAKKLVANYECLLEGLNIARRKQSRMPLPPPKPFYAYLFMDGDGLGEMVSTEKTIAEKVSRGLGSFAKQALFLVHEYNGVPIYAGADDLAALLPIETAIPAALSLERAYRMALSPAITGTALKPTISAGLVLADFQYSLRQVREHAGRLLNDMAKEGNGRDSIAIAVVKSGGVAAEWVSAWNAKYSPASKLRSRKCRPVLTLHMLAKEQGKRGIQTPLASRFCYQLEERFPTFFSRKAMTADAAPLGGDKSVLDLLRAEYADSAPRGKLEDTKLDRLLARLLLLSQRHKSERRRPDDKQPQGLTIGGLLVLRFLAKNGLWP